MNFQNPNFVGSNQWTPELMNQWSSNQELLYQNIPHDKVDWAGLAKQWIDMQSMLFSEMQFIHQQPQLGQQFGQLNPVLLPPPMHLGNFNLPPFSHSPIQSQQHFHPLDHQLQHLNNQFNHPAPLLSQINPPPPPQLNHPMGQQINQQINHQINNAQQFSSNLNHNQQQNFVLPQNQLRAEPPLLPPFELGLKNNHNNQFNHADRNKFNHSNNNFKKKNKNVDRSDLKPKKEKQSGSKSSYGEKSARQSESEKANRTQKNSNHNSESNQKPHQSKAPINQLQFNQAAGNKVNPLIPNQLGQEPAPVDESSGSGLFDASKRKKLPEWIREGLEKMEKEKQKQIEKEESRAKKAKEEQLRKELELDEDDEEPAESGQKDGHRDEEPTKKTGEEKRKLFSSVFHQKTFADMFLVKKPKEYYYENEQEREKELMLRTRKVLTNILLEVTDALVRQVASKAIQEAKIQKSGIVSQYYSDSDQSESDEKKKDGKKKSESSRRPSGSSERRSASRERRSRSRDRRKSSNERYRRSKSNERRRSSKDESSKPQRRSRSKERFGSRRSRSREDKHRRSHKRSRSNDRPKDFRDKHQHHSSSSRTRRTSRSRSRSKRKR